MTVAIKSFAVKDPLTVRDDILRTLKNGLISRGVATPQVGPGSEAFIWATALANELSVVAANTIIKADAQMPDTATGSDLDRIVAIYGLARRAAGGSSGQMTITTSANTFIATGSQLIDSGGLRYTVSTGGTYTNASPTNLIAITALDTGKATNHAVGDVLRWVSAPPYAAPTTIVATGGLTGGVDLEDDNTLRARLFSRLQNPPGGGNWTQCKMIAEAASTSVMVASVYPAANGPATVHIAVAGYPQTTGTLSATSKNRDVAAALMTGTITPYIQGNLPEYVESVVTTVTNVTNDVAFGIALPSSPAAVPSGPGGGWIDGTPWPGNTALAATFKCTVTAVTSSTVFTVDAPSNPTAGVSHICFLDPTTWTLQRAKVLSYTSTAPTAVITIDTPFTNIAIGNFIFPDCTNAQVYITAILTAFANMGPGEKSATAAVLTRGYRHPQPVNSWPMALVASQLRQLASASAEILDVSYLYRQFTGSPATPGVITSPPGIFVPKNIGLYATT